MANIVTRPLDPLAKSRAQLDQLPPALKKAVEQMLWRAKGCVESRKFVTPRLVSLTEPDEIMMGRGLGHPFLFVLRPATVGKQVEIQKTKGAFVRFLEISRNLVDAASPQRLLVSTFKALHLR